MWITGSYGRASRLPATLSPLLPVLLQSSQQGGSRQQELRNQGYSTIPDIWPVSPADVLFKLHRHTCLWVAGCLKVLSKFPFLHASSLNVPCKGTATVLPLVRHYPALQPGLLPQNSELAVLQPAQLGSGERSGGNQVMAQEKAAPWAGKLAFNRANVFRAPGLYGEKGMAGSDASVRGDLPGSHWQGLTPHVLRECLCKPGVIFKESQIHMMKTSCFEKQERWNHSYCLPVLLISQERASGAQGLNLVNSYNAEHFNFVLIPKLNFEKRPPWQKCGLCYPSICTHRLG